MGLNKIFLLHLFNKELYELYKYFFYRKVVWLIGKYSTSDHLEIN